MTLGSDPEMQIVRTETLGIRVDAAADPQTAMQLVDIDRRSGGCLCTFVNPGAVAAADRSPRYRAVLREFDFVLPDGIGMCWAIRLVHGLRAGRISFDTTSFAPVVFDHAVRLGLSVALVGGKAGIAAQAAERLVVAFPGLRIVAALDGYGEHSDKIDQLMALAPSIVVCGMGVGVQEQFLIDLCSAGWTGAGFTCGGYLDQLVGGINYYPRWVDATNLRFAYRLVREPRRLAHRYLVDYSRFATRLLWTIAHRRTGRRQSPLYVRRSVPVPPQERAGAVASLQQVRARSDQNRSAA